jgi:DHA2 family multidrug resistance protein-like MFS transporter
MDMTVMYLALPEISTALQPSSAQLLWITDIYGFLEAGFLITMGTLGDRMGRRKLLLTGAVAFTIASALAAFATTAAMLISARALLGIAGATLLPSTLSLIRNMFHDAAQRTFAIGAWTTIFSAGTMLGPLVGGFLLAHFWWGSVFLMGVPVMLIFLVVGPLLLPEFKDPIASKFDLPSAGLLIITTLTIIYGIKQMAEHGASLLYVLSITVGLVVGFIFLRRQKTLHNPLIDLQLFKKPAFSASLGALMVALFSWVGISLFVGQYLQLVLGMDPFKAGLWTIPAAASSIVTCMLAPQLVRYFHRGWLMAAGLAVMATGIALFTQAHALPLFITATVIMSAGCGFTVTLSTDVVVATAPPERAGAAAGISETSTSFGGALGVAILGSIWMALYRSGIVHLLPAGVPAAQAKAARSTLGGALTAAEQLQGALGDELLRAAREAFTESFHFTAGVCAVIAMVVAGIVGVVLRRLREVRS